MKSAFILGLVLMSSLQAAINPDLPDASVLTEKYLEEISKREIGQTKFAVKNSYFPRPMASTARGGQAEMNSASNREIQESDVYKLGKKGKKELFLLNRYRGFQVVSFEAGLDAPKIVGRFPVYNNWNSEMYYLEAQDQVIVLNTEWSFQPNSWATNYNTTIYLMDVADSAHPKVIKETNITGYLENSRLVGDVLYTITNSGNWNERKAMITSVKISDDEINTIDGQELHGENRWVRTMNVLKDGEKYYVISTLNDWRSNGDYINVHDITSPKGDIMKVFSAKARGQITERSQTFIHKNHLFAVSNYRENENAVMRISVEAMPLTSSTEIVTSKPNMRISVGDTTGLHASLQDVRISGDLLYAFWVPANNIDPFDLFDISEPAKGIKHLGQLQFDGWISKAFPIQYNNKEYVLGLGWVVPATSENNKRYPQAKLFEVKKVGNSFKHEVVASLTLDSDDVWSSLNQEDKFFEIIEEKTGVYNIMFPVSFTKNWKSGAKIVNVDLNLVNVTEGANIVGEHGWLNRVFINREVRAINSFSDLALETFDQNDLIGQGIAKTVSTLELARNIIDFKVISEEQGLQIIRNDNQVELRKVSLKNTDAEKIDVLKMAKIDGNYQWHKMKNGKLYVMTTFNKKVQRGDAQYRYETEVFDYAKMNTVDLKTLEATSNRLSISSDLLGEDYYYFQMQNISTEKDELFMVGNKLFRMNGDSLDQMLVASDCQYFFENKENNLSVDVVGNEFYAFNNFNLNVKTTENAERPWSRTTYTMPFVKKLTLTGNTVSCSASINVPGKPALIDKGFMVTGEMEYRYFPWRINYEYYPMGGFHGPLGKTFSLKFKTKTQVEMTDILEKNITEGLYQTGFITYSAAESRLDLWKLDEEGNFYSRPEYLQYKASQKTALISVRPFQNRNFVFMKNDKKVDLYELKKGKLSQIKVTSTHDLDESDDSAEFIFSMEALEANKDLSRIHVSQGLYGLTDIILK